MHPIEYQPSGYINIGSGGYYHRRFRPIIQNPQKTLVSVPVKAGIVMGSLYLIDQIPSARAANGLLGVRRLILPASRLGLIGAGITVGALLVPIEIDRYRLYKNTTT